MRCSRRLGHDFHCGRAAGATPFGFLAVRVARSMGVRDGGGRILNSEGDVNEKGCFRKPARWVDCTGPVTATLDEGIALMDHPGNLHHPGEFTSATTDGWGPRPRPGSPT